MHGKKENTLDMCTSVCACAGLPAGQSQGVGCIRPSVLFPCVGKPPSTLHAICIGLWPMAVSSCPLLVSQECTGTNVSFSTRCSLGTPKEEVTSGGCKDHESDSCREDLYEDEATEVGRRDRKTELPLLSLAHRPDISMPDLASRFDFRH